ncbi:monocarboxylate transporter 9-like [Teleopsis dalmanni]|uniref:monocarboxylate transporter 9-like n=1 Tax=Teleopsis dalmanni TaxID=139649 RepID=UPI0018CDC5BC|nr:monocarboxylate transporter 9-like [Teleopsis dalmanni]
MSGSVTTLEAPDGGWGIFVCIGMAMPFISGLAALPSFGLIFGDFLKSISAETSAIAFITSAFFCAFSFAGLFSGSLFNRFGLRNVGILGGVLYFLGSFFQIFVTSTTTLLLSFSLIQGVGFGLIVPTSYTTFNNYFVKKRVMWMSFAQSLIGVGTMVYPVLMQKLMESYGFRGCLLILSAINAHAILGMVLMQPVEWHMRRIQVVDQELVEKIINSKQNNLIEIKKNTVEKNNKEKLNIIETRNSVVPSNNVQPNSLKETEVDADNGNHLSPLMVYSRKSSYKFSKEDLKILASRSSSITSLGNWTGPIIVSDASPEMTHFPTSQRSSVISSIKGPIQLRKSNWQYIIDFLDLTLMKNPIYVNIVLGISFALYSDIAFFTLQPIYMFELGFSKPDTASIIAIGAAADLISRIFLAFSAVFIQMPSRYIYLAGSFFTVISRFGE